MNHRLITQSDDSYQPSYQAVCTDQCQNTVISVEHRGQGNVTESLIKLKRYLKSYFHQALEKTSSQSLYSEFWIEFGRFGTRDVQILVSLYQVPIFIFQYSTKLDTDIGEWRLLPSQS